MSTLHVSQPLTTIQETAEEAPKISKPFSFFVNKARHKSKQRNKVLSQYAPAASPFTAEMLLVHPMFVLHFIGYLKSFGQEGHARHLQFYIEAKKFRDDTNDKNPDTLKEDAQKICKKYFILQKRYFNREIDACPNNFKEVNKDFFDKALIFIEQRELIPLIKNYLKTEEKLFSKLKPFITFDPKAYLNYQTPKNAKVQTSVHKP